MIRETLMAVLVGCGGLTACSSSSSSSSCQVAGTYTVNGAVESGDCQTSADPVTDTFVANSDGSVTLLIQGLPDFHCTGKVDSACKWTAACTSLVTDATSSSQNEATLQYSYSFSASGLTGIVSESFPPAKSLPNGCRGTVKVSGTRR